MKRILTLLLAILMTFSLAACGDKAEDDPRIDENGNMTDGMETETLMNEDNFTNIMTELGFGDYIVHQEVNQDGMNSWTGAIYTEGEDAVNLYAIMFDYEGHPEEAQAKRTEIKQVSENFEVFFYDLKDEMLLALGANGEYTSLIPGIIAGLGYQ